MIGRKIKNTGNNCGKSDRNSKCNPLRFGKSAESRSTTPQGDDQSDDEANNETERRQRKKDQHPAPTLEIGNVIEFGQIQGSHDRKNSAGDRSEERDRDDAQRSHFRRGSGS